MYRNADLRLNCKTQAKAAVHKLFLPSMVASLVCLIPMTLAGYCYKFDQNEAIEISKALSILSTSFIISLLIDVFILSPIIMGGFNYFTKCIKHSKGEQKPSLLDLFYCFETAERYFMTVKLALIISLYTILWCCLLFVALFATLWLTLLHNAFIVLAYIVSVPLSIFISAKIASYYGAYVILAENPKISTLSAVKQSSSWFKGHLSEIILFEFSFIGWVLLSILTFGIVGVYTFAYFVSSFICYVNALNPQNTQNEQNFLI